MRTCSDEIAGKYHCYNNPEAINYLILNEDGSFMHYYEHDETILTDSGKWRLSEKNNCMLEFSSWMSYNLDGMDANKFMNGLLWINGKYLDIGPDGDSQTSFI